MPHMDIRQEQVRSSPLVSIVVPCFNEGEVLPQTISTLDAELDSIRVVLSVNFQVVFVNDGSRDRTPEILREAAKNNPAYRVVHLSRNFGHQAAIAAGLREADGDAVVILDADLQDPPALIAEMLVAWREGAKVVHGYRTRRESRRLRYVLSRWHYRTLNRFSDISLPLDSGDFRLLDRSVIDILLSLPERSLYFRGLSAWVGFKQVGIPYQRDARYAGESKYTKTRLMRLAGDGFLGFTTIPLKFGLFAGLSMAGIAVLGIFFALVQWIITERWIGGSTAIFIALLFFSGVQALLIGIVGFYIGQIQDDLRARPRYLIEDVTNPAAFPNAGA